jgi:hypothetical protein
MSLVLLLGPACATAGSNTNRTPASEDRTSALEEQGAGTYPGPCSPLGFSVVEKSAPSAGAGIPNNGEDSLNIVATVRPGERPQRVGDVVKPLEMRERQDDLQSQLVQRTVPACGPESKPGNKATQ